MTTANSSAPKELVTAALLVIGDEILSGRTKDKNIAYIAEYLTAVGIDLREVRVVGDEEGPIVEALNALRHRYTYVFTTGGIGPTHDDITADCVAKAFGVPIDVDPRALAILQERLRATGAEMNEARLRMTRIPKGADLVINKVSGAPGAFGTKYDEAAWLLDRLVSNDDFVDFLTEPAYELVSAAAEPLVA